MLFKGFFRAFLMVALAALSAEQVNAGVLYDNLAQPSGGSDTVSSIGSGYGPLADSFSTDASGAFLSHETLSLQSNVAHPVSGGNFIVSLLSDAGGATSPGSFLTVLGSMSDSQLSSSLQNYDFALSTPYQLSPNTRYWIQISSGSGGDTSAEWSYSSNASGTGITGEYFANSGGSYSISDPDYTPYQMAVFTSAAPVVPEPSAIVLAAIGVVGLGAGRAIRHRRAS